MATTPARSAHRRLAQELDALRRDRLSHECSKSGAPFRDHAGQR